MAFIGNTNTTQSFAPAIDYFNGNGSTVAFTLSRPVASVAQVQAVINNVPQNPSSAYTVSGNTITFTSAPSAGTSNIYVYYTSPITQVVQPSTGTVGKTQLDVYGGTGTGAMTVPAGTTAQRPSNPVVGDTRWNSTLNQLECWVGSGWSLIVSSNYSASYLAVAGGGGGGCSYGGGGGAGGFVPGTVTLSRGTVYTITVGAGGAGTSSVGSFGTSGSTSSISTIASAVGGGGGAGRGIGNGLSGGSGGGAGDNYPGSPAYVGGAGTPGQGFAGGGGTYVGFLGSGGGGAGAVGANSSSGGAGGAGLASTITGVSVVYAGGGGGGNTVSAGYNGGAGGSGGGGSGSGAGASSVAGSVNSGGGGGGGGDGAVLASSAGGSGVVIISVPTANYSGTTTGSPTVTTSGSNTILKFTVSGTYTA
jgi:hypothetical protein